MNVSNVYEFNLIQLTESRQAVVLIFIPMLRAHILEC